MLNPTARIVSRLSAASTILLPSCVLVANGFSINTSYEYQDIQSLGGTTLSREEHRLNAGITWTNQQGLFASLLERYRDINYDNNAKPDEEIWLTDFELVYQLKERKGITKLSINNLFDEKINWHTDNFVFAGRIPRREVLLSLTLNL